MSDDDAYGYTLPDFTNKSFSTYNNSFKACNTPSTDAINCEDYQECYQSGSGVLNSSSTLSPICCTAYQSCYQASAVNAYVNVYDTGIRMDGSHAGFAISGEINARNGGNVYFSGFYAGWGVALVSTTNEWDIIASGYYGLADSVIKVAKNLYCLGLNSCERSTVNNISNAVYALAQYSLPQSNVSSIGGNVYCLGHYACYQCILSMVNENVIGIGLYVLRYSWFENIGGTVLGYGEYAMNTVTVINTPKVRNYVYRFS